MVLNKLHMCNLLVVKQKHMKKKNPIHFKCMEKKSVCDAFYKQFFFCHIFSVLGHRIPDLPVPLFNVYPASKYALTAITQTIRQELAFQQANIKLTVCAFDLKMKIFSI